MLYISATLFASVAVMPLYLGTLFGTPYTLPRFLVLYMPPRKPYEFLGILSGFCNDCTNMSDFTGAEWEKSLLPLLLFVIALVGWGFFLACSPFTFNVEQSGAPTVAGPRQY